MWIGEWRRRVWYLVHRRRVERDLDDEMAVHREMMRQPRRFGNPLKLREDVRDVWGWGWVDRLAQDVRQAIRVLLRAPGFSIAALVILTAGIGLNLTFVHILRVTSLQPLAVKNPDTLVQFDRRGEHFYSNGVPFPEVQFIAGHNDVLAAVLAHHSSEVVWDGDPASGRLDVAFVSPNWFDELGYGASLGRVFHAGVDSNDDAPLVAVLTDQFWRTRLVSAPDIVGRTIRLNDEAITVVGVVPPAFPDLDLHNPQVWLLIQQVDRVERGTAFKDTWTINNTMFFGRLRPGISAAAAADGLRPAIAALAQLRPAEFHTDESLDPATAADRFVHARDRRQLLRMAALVGGLMLLVLIVASANLGNLVLSRAIGRLRELSVRAALGASRWRLLRQLVVESSLLAALGAVGGLALGYTGARLVATVADLPPYLNFTPDRGLFAAAFAVAFVAMLAFGLVPAWMVTRRDLIGAIRDGGHQTSVGLSRTRFRLALVGAQVAGCCALLVVAAAMTRGLQKLFDIDIGPTINRIAVVDASLVRHGIEGRAARAYWATVMERLAANPEVERLARAYPEPFGRAINESSYAAAPSLKIANMRVDPEFFSVFDIPIIAGRIFTRADDPARVIVISRRAALAMYGSLDILGQGFPLGSKTRLIIGIVEDAPLVSLRGSGGAEQYSPITDRDEVAVVLVARSRSTTPGRLLQPMRDAAHAADGRVQPTTGLLANEYNSRMRAPRLVNLVAALVAGLVLMLACLGIFGVVAYAAKLRTKEIGIRRALGADAPLLLAVLLRQLCWPVGVGMVVGTVVGLPVTRLLGRNPPYLALADATAPTAALIIFALVGLAAAIVPAARAMRADPVRALRHE